ncbi:MAG: polymer-forming cytoskeletal [Firmicutes bacterium]|nr:polymer-forming cytoskeletal [Bacillota bacterium]
MFGSKSKAQISLEQVETIVGKNTCVKGMITAKGSLRIDGQLEGDIDTEGDLVVGPTGILKSNIKARKATIAGVVNGNVNLEDKLELLPTGKLIGDVKVGSIIIGEGALFQGVCEMKQPDMELQNPALKK